MTPLGYALLFAGLWLLLNGLLHDIFVLIQKRPFERELIRLLIDGHILIFSGILDLLCIRGVNARDVSQMYIALTVSLFVIGYCLLIFKILPSAGTLLIHAVVLAWLIISIYHT